VMAELSNTQLAVPIGRPIDNTQVYVLDNHRQPVPVGIAGELFIGGDGLAAGYWQHPELTAERFVPDPFSSDPQDRLYRTGDLVRFLPDGQLEFLGRLDSQVKVRGFRIELEEVESVMREHPRVGMAAASVMEAGPSDQRLVAFFTGREDGPPGEDALRDYLRGRLPAYMVPSQLVGVAQLPLTPSGKVDRRSLVAQQAAAPPHPGLPPGDNTEMLLLEIWEEVLGRRPIRPDQDFFALGGHSLLGARLLARVEKTFGTRLALASFFETPTVARMAARLREGAPIAHSRVIPIRSGEGATPLFVLHPGPVLRHLTLALPERQPLHLIWVFDAGALAEPCRLEDIARRQVEAIRESQSEGPYAIAGWCADGVLAYEMAQQLRALGQTVELVVLIDSFNPARLRRVGRLESARLRIAARASRLRFHFASLSGLSPAGKAGYLRDRWHAVRDSVRTDWWRAMHSRHGSKDKAGDADQTLRYAVSRYDPQPYDGAVLLFRALNRPASSLADAADGWKALAPRMEVVDVPGTHRGMLLPPHVEAMARRLADRLRLAPSKSNGAASIELISAESALPPASVVGRFEEPAHVGFKEK